MVKNQKQLLESIIDTIRNINAQKEEEECTKSKFNDKFNLFDMEVRDIFSSSSY